MFLKHMQVNSQFQNILMLKVVLYCCPLVLFGGGGGGRTIGIAGEGTWTMKRNRNRDEKDQNMDG